MLYLLWLHSKSNLLLHGIWFVELHGVYKKNFPRCGILTDSVQHASSMHSLLQCGMYPHSVDIYCWHWIVFLLDYERYYRIFTRCVFCKNFDISTLINVEFQLMMMDARFIFTLNCHWYCYISMIYALPRRNFMKEVLASW